MAASDSANVGQAICAAVPQCLSGGSPSGLSRSGCRRRCVPGESVSERRAPRRMSSSATSVGAPCNPAWCRTVNHAVPPGRHQLMSTCSAGSSTRPKTVDQSATLDRISHTMTRRYDVRLMVDAQWSLHSDASDENTDLGVSNGIRTGDIQDCKLLRPDGE